MNPTRPLGKAQVVVGRGAGLEPKTIAAGTAGQVLTQVTLGADPVFAAPATVDLTTGVTGVLPIANGGTGQTVGVIAALTFWGLAVAGNTTTFLGIGAGTEATITIPSPVSGNVVRVQTWASVAPGGVQTFDYRLRVTGANGAATQTATGAAVSTTSTGNTAAVVLGDLLAIRLATSATAQAANHIVTIAIRVSGTT